MDLLTLQMPTLTDETRTEYKLRLKKVEHDNTRQNLGCLLVLLNAAHKLEQHGTITMEYALEDEIDRGIIRDKIIELVKTLK